MGYTISSKNCTDLREGWQVQHTNIATSAFMDDTTWLASCQEELQQIIKTAEEFYTINDIQINSKKSALLIINGTEQDRQSGIILHGEKIFGEAPDSPVRILGIWHSAKGNKKHQIDFIKQKINHTNNLIKTKFITDKQARYIINYALMPSIKYLLNE